MGLDYIDPDQAADEAREEAEVELAYAEEREREAEEKQERQRCEREEEFDQGLAEHLDRMADEQAEAAEAKP
jgi:hypothetical protein